MRRTYVTVFAVAAPEGSETILMPPPLVSRCGSGSATGRVACPPARYPLSLDTNSTSDESAARAHLPVSATSSGLHYRIEGDADTKWIVYAGYPF